MKIKILSIILFLLPFITEAQSLIRPEFLHKGDSVAIISPASMPDLEYVDAGVKVLSSWGLVPVVGQYATKGFGSFSGTIEERLSDLKWAFESKGIKAVMCTRGGYGSVQELCCLEPGYFNKHPKWLIGYSDISAIHSSMSSDSVMSIHGHMCSHLQEFGGKDSCSIVLRNLLFGKIPTYRFANSSDLNHRGKAEGILLGGNISVINDIGGSRIDALSKYDNIILYIEDLEEAIYAINRMLYRMKAAGVLDKINGLIVGDFHGYKPDKDFDNMYQMIESVVKDYKIPIVYKFPVGHIDNNFPLINGSIVELEVSQKETLLRYK
ncbi:MAG: LD-carboxypeptidase [Muribaculaceae bacterium]|nr:LD-carboxypeptidase [Muribaculaceae bacterium]